MLHLHEITWPVIHINFNSKNMEVNASSIQDEFLYAFASLKHHDNVFVHYSRSDELPPCEKLWGISHGKGGLPNKNSIWNWTL